MKKLALILASVSLVANALLAASAKSQTANFNPKSAKEHLVIKMQILDKNANKDAGEVVAIQTPYGVAFFPNLKGLEAGLHGFHIHENADCGATDKGLGMKAGGHYDPDKTGTHSFAWDDKGHKGDLPALFVDSEGNANNPVLTPKIKDLNEIKNRSLMIHFGGDNHSDKPAPLGGGGARMACGVIK